MSIKVTMSDDGSVVTSIDIDDTTSNAFSNKISRAIAAASQQTQTGGTQSSGLGRPSGGGFDLDISSIGDANISGKLFPQLAIMSSINKEVSDKQKKLEEKILKVPAKAHDFFRQIDEDLRNFNLHVQKTFGGIPVVGEKATNEAAKRMSEGFDEIVEAANKTGDRLTDANLVLELDTGSAIEKVNLIDKALGGEEQVIEDYKKFMTAYAGTMESKFQEALKGQQVQISRFNQGLGLSQEQIAAMLTRQVATTGEASTKMLEDLQTQSYAVADAVGGNAKLIAQQSSDIIKDVKNFGNVTVEEATRMAAAIQHAGIEYSSFTSMLGKFQTFEGATKAMSDLTSVFGIHMDSMELMMLANEDQEQFLHRIKEGFESQGLAMEDMNLAQKRVLADTIGMSVQQAELYFQDGALPDQAEMEQASITANAEEAVKRLNEDIANVVHEGTKLQEVVAQGVDKSFTAPLRRAAYRNANVIRVGAAAISTELKEASNAAGEELLSTFGEIGQAISAGTSDDELAAIFTDMMVTYGDGIMNATQGIVDNIGNVFQKFADDWWQPNVGYNSPSPLFGQPFYDGLMAGVNEAVSDTQESFLAISDSMAKLVVNTGLPSLLDDLNESTMIATSIAGDGTTGISQSIQVLNEASIDNLPKMVEKLTKLNTLLDSHIKQTQEGTETKLAVSLNLDTKMLYEEIVNYRHTSGGTFSINAGETKGG